jgi:hypothetical protein
MIDVFLYDWKSGISVVKHWLTTEVTTGSRATGKESLTVQTCGKGELAK